MKTSSLFYPEVATETTKTRMRRRREGKGKKEGGGEVQKEIVQHHIILFLFY